MNFSIELQTNKSSADFDAAIAYTYSSDAGSFQSSVELRNITYILVGYYYCVKNSSENDRLSPELSLSKKASRVYLFVEGLSLFTACKLQETVEKLVEIRELFLFC